MSRDLPARASLEHLRKQAKELLREVERGDTAALERLRAHVPDAGPRVKLADAQHVIAREYGSATWPALKARVAQLAGNEDPFQLLGAAIGANDTEAVASVLDHFPAVRARLNEPVHGGSFGSTALLGAVQQRNRDMIELLLRAGADIHQRSHWWAGGFGVLDDDHDLAEFLIARGARVDAYAAARHGMLDRLEGLVANDPGVARMRGGDGQTPLHVAKNVEVARYLVEHGAEIDALDVDHESTPAQYHVRDRQDVVRFLIDRGCRTDVLMVAALGDVERVRAHLDADPAVIRTVVTPEYFPMRNPHAGGTIYTWTLGANRSAHAVARAFGHEPVYRLLFDRSPEELKLTAAVEVGDEPAISALLARRPDLVTHLEPGAHRRLVDAAQDNDLAAVRRFLDAGWPLDARGRHAATALHWAAFHGNAEMVRELAGRGAPLDLRDRDFDGTPLSWAFHGSRNGWHRETGDYAGAVEALLDAGAPMPASVQGLNVSEPVRALLLRRGAMP